MDTVVHWWRFRDLLVVLFAIIGCWMTLIGAAFVLWYILGGDLCV